MAKLSCVITGVAGRDRQPRADDSREHAADAASRLHTDRRGGDGRRIMPMDLQPRIPSIEALRWSIKIAAPAGRRLWWGDFHFAEGLSRALQALGQHVTIHAHEDWYGPTAPLDDVVLVLRGLKPYQPDDRQINLLWVISHPEEVTRVETTRYDGTFVATPLSANSHHRGVRPVEPLLQATDPQRFCPGPTEADLRHEVLFVGNTRWRLRRSVEHALAAGLPLSVYGDGWDGQLPDTILRGARIPNKKLPRYYRSAGVVLNDHWEDMRREKLLSNRLFDAAACGARVVSDSVVGMESVFGDAIYTYEGPDQLGLVARRLLAEPDADSGRRRELAEHIRANHTFTVRARRLVTVAQEIAAQRAALRYEDGNPVVMREA